MDREQAQTLLATRSSLTGSPYGDGTIDAWHTALAGEPFPTVRLALIAACRDMAKVTVHDVISRLPKPATTGDPAPDRCELCQSTGWTETDPHPLQTCPYPGASGCHCHAVRPCRCTAGQRHIELFMRLNNRTGADQ